MEPEKSQPCGWGPGDFLLKKTRFWLGKNKGFCYPNLPNMWGIIMAYHGLMMGIPIDHIFFPCSSPRRHEMGMMMMRMRMMMMMMMMRMATRLDVLCIKRPATSITLTENGTIHFPEDLPSSSSHSLPMAVWVGRMPSIPSQLNQQCNQLLYSSQKLLGEVPLPFCFSKVLGGHLQSCETYDFTTPPEALTGSLNQPFSSLKPPWYPHRFPIPWNFHQYPRKSH